MKKRFKNILGNAGKKNGAALLICAVLLTVSLGTLVGCSIAKENTADGSEPLEIGDTANLSGADEEIQPGPSSSTDGEMQPGPSSSTDEEMHAGPSSSTDGETQDTESDFDHMFSNPVYLEDYYNTPEGKAAIEADYADLAGEGMSVSINVILDEIIVTVKYEDSALLTEGIEEALAQQLDSMEDRFWHQTITYDEIITWRSIVTVRYTDPEGNVLAERSYSGE